MAVLAISLYASDLTENQVPQTVKNAIAKKYSQANKIEWEKKGVYYQAEFKIDRREHEVLIDEKGNIVSVYEDITKNELPQKAVQTIQNRYVGYKYSDVEKITKDGSVMYKVELEHGEHEVTLFFDKNGDSFDKQTIENK